MHGDGILLRQDLMVGCWSDPAVSRIVWIGSWTDNLHYDWPWSHTAGASNTQSFLVQLTWIEGLTCVSGESNVPTSEQPASRAMTPKHSIKCPIKASHKPGEPSKDQGYSLKPMILQ